MLAQPPHALPISQPRALPPPVDAQGTARGGQVVGVACNGVARGSQTVEAHIPSTLFCNVNGFGAPSAVAAATAAVDPGAMALLPHPLDFAAAPPLHQYLQY